MEKRARGLDRARWRGLSEVTAAGFRKPALQRRPLVAGEWYSRGRASDSGGEVERAGWGGQSEDAI